MNKRTQSQQEILLDANLDFIMNAPEEEFDAYLAESGEDGDELARKTSLAIESALAKHKEADQATNMAPTTDPVGALSVPQLRDLAARLGIPRQVLTAFRERRVVLTSVPRRFLKAFAAAMQIAVEQLTSALAAPLEPKLRSHKADKKPDDQAVVTFEQLLIDAGVAPDRRAELLQEDD